MSKNISLYDFAREWNNVKRMLKGVYAGPQDYLKASKFTVIVTQEDRERLVRDSPDKNYVEFIQYDLLGEGKETVKFDFGKLNDPASFLTSSAFSSSANRFARENPREAAESLSVKIDKVNSTLFKDLNDKRLNLRKEVTDSFENTYIKKLNEVENRIAKKIGPKLSPTIKDRKTYLEFYNDRTSKYAPSFDPVVFYGDFLELVSKLTETDSVNNYESAINKFKQEMTKRMADVGLSVNSKGQLLFQDKLISDLLGEDYERFIPLLDMISGENLDKYSVTDSKGKKKNLIFSKADLNQYKKSGNTVNELLTKLSYLSRIAVLEAGEDIQKVDFKLSGSTTSLTYKKFKEDYQGKGTLPEEWAREFTQERLNKEPYKKSKSGKKLKGISSTISGTMNPSASKKSKEDFEIVYYFKDGTSFTEKIEAKLGQNDRYSTSEMKQTIREGIDNLKITDSKLFEDFLDVFMQFYYINQISPSDEFLSEAYLALLQLFGKYLLFSGKDFEENYSLSKEEIESGEHINLFLIKSTYYWTSDFIKILYNIIKSDAEGASVRQFAKSDKSFRGSQLVDTLMMKLSQKSNLKEALTSEELEKLKTIMYSMSVSYSIDIKEIR